MTLKTTSPETSNSANKAGSATLGPVLEADRGEDPKLNPEKILDAAIVGVVAALGYDIGIAIAYGPPLGPREAIADTISGFIGGAAGEIIFELTNNDFLGTGVGAVLTGFFYQLVFEALPKEKPPEESPSQRGKVRAMKMKRPGKTSHPAFAPIGFGAHLKNNHLAGSPSFS